MTDRAHNCDEEDIAIRNQIVMLVNIWKIYVFLIYVSMTKSKQRSLSVSETILDRAKQLYRTFVSSYLVTRQYLLKYEDEEDENNHDKMI
jgi:EamA domain-containing membrane protein RarD